MITESERPCRWDMLVFGVSATCIPRRRVKSTTLRMSDSHETQIATLSMRVENDSVVQDVSCQLTIAAAVAENLLRLAERSVPNCDVTRLRAALDAARLICLGPLIGKATER